MAEMVEELTVVARLKIVGGRKTLIGLKIINVLAKLFGIEVDGVMTVQDNA